MANKPRSGLAGWQKALLWAVGLFVLWQVAMTNAIGNGLLGFFLGGEVPGTNIVLPPEVILMGTLGVAVLIVVVVVARMWAGHRRVRKFHAELTESAAADTPEAEPKPEPESEPKPELAAVVAATAKPDKTPKQRRVGPALAVAVVKSRQIAQYGLRRLGPWSQKAANGMKKASSRGAVHSIGVYELLRMATIFCAQWLWQHSVALAQWLGARCKVYAKQLRTWLKHSGKTVRPHVKRLASNVAVAWGKTAQWVRRQSRGCVKQAKQAVNYVKRMVHKSPVSGWIASAQKKFRSPDQPKE